jgi:hypothetical protein
MALHSGLDTTAIISHGVYSKTYGAVHGKNIASLFVSRGLLERAHILDIFMWKILMKKIQLKMIELIKIALH